MAMGTTETVELGGLHFVVMHRSFGEDGGISIEVFGDVDGQRMQVLRFDCFRNEPHYHHAPMGKNIVTNLEASGIDGSVAWALGQIRDRTPDLLREAGYEHLAGVVDAQAVAGGVDRIQAAIAAAIPRS